MLSSPSITSSVTSSSPSANFTSSSLSIVTSSTSNTLSTSTASLSTVMAAAAAASSRMPLAPPPPHPLSTQHISTHPHPFDMLYSQNNRQQQTTHNYGHLTASSSPNPSREKLLVLSSPASANQVADAHSKTSTGLIGSFRSSNGSIQASVKATAQQMAMAMAAENAAAYYTAAAAAAAAASMLNPVTSVNPFGNPLDWLGACTTSKRSTSTISSPSLSVNSQVMPIIGNSNTSSRTGAISGRHNNSGTCLSKSPVGQPTVGDFMSMLHSQAINNINDRSNSKNMADLSQINGLEAAAAAALHQRSSMLTSSNVISSSTGQSVGPTISSSSHKGSLLSGTTTSLPTVSVPTSTSAAHAAAAAAAASTLFGSVSPFSAPPIINPYAHLPGVVANAAAHGGAHSLPSPTIYPPTPPPSAPWIHPWYAGDTF